MTHQQIREKFVKFFLKNKHKLIESYSLIPHGDPSVLLTTAGMQQFKPYFIGAKDPMKDFKSRRLISIQRCFRTSDIEEVGDAWHNTFFEMLGNFSIADYFKKEAIDLAWQFLIKEMKIDKKKLWATYFKGDKQVEADKETGKLWEKCLPKEKIRGYSREDNWWGPTGKTGPCGPCSEIHYDFTGKPCDKDEKCLPNCECHRFMELWNLVFTEYNIDEKGKLKELPTKNIDTGMGLERLALVVQKKNNIYETDLFISLMEKIARDTAFGKLQKIEDLVRSRVLADHVKGAVFLIYDGVLFSNKEQGYILRRIFRRASDQFLFPNFSWLHYIDKVLEIYHSTYPYLLKRRDGIADNFIREQEAYKKIQQLEVKEVIEKISQKKREKQTSDIVGPSSREISPAEAFLLYSTYGLSPEKLKREGFVFDEVEFQKELERHKKLSRSGAEKKFGGHGLTSQEIPEKDRLKIIRLHTSTHLLQKALRDILGNHVKQEGSDINKERLRFDFTHPQKLTDEEIKRVEDLVNQKIRDDLPVSFQEMPYEEAVKIGALAFFKEKYPEKVKVYSVSDYSKEICGGPHVEHTGQIGRFKILSEKSSSAGIRRIKATVE